PRFSSERQFIAAIHDDRLSLAPGYIQAAGLLSGFRISPLVTAPHDTCSSTPLWRQMPHPTTSPSAKTSWVTSTCYEACSRLTHTFTRFNTMCCPGLSLYKPQHKIQTTRKTYKTLFCH